MCSMIRQFELVDSVRDYNPAADAALINRAYVFGVRAHGEQKRASGEPYFNHPVEVAAILTRLRLDDATIVTALLHDTLEDTVATREELAGLFGEEITRMIEGVTKLSKLAKTRQDKPQERAEPTPGATAPEAASERAAEGPRAAAQAAEQAENFRRLFMAMARDPRVLLVKMADRLHNMRTIGHLRPEKRSRIAEETLEIFAPLAGRMGMQWMREELEDLAFAVLRPEARKSVIRRFAHLRRTSGDGVIDEIVTALRGVFEAAGITADVVGREKRPYAIWRKMQQKAVTFAQLSDIIAFRVLVGSEADCYAALGAAHCAFRAVPDRFKDYISGPKSNGYRSLHTTLVGPSGARIEIQIRTHEMHEVAESGVAAHWSYKDGQPGANRFAVDPFPWLKDLAARGDAAADSPEEFLEDAKREMIFDQVFCFTPKGEVIDLPRGATALDFAYAIHTDVGHTAVGVRVDGKRAPLWAQLRNGQTVEVLQSAGQKPNPHWPDMARTGRARAAIRRSLRQLERSENAALGQKLAERAFARAGAEFGPKASERAAAVLGFSEPGALLAAIGAAALSAEAALGAVHPELAATAAAPLPDAASAAPEPEPELSAALNPGRPQVMLASVLRRRPAPPGVMVIEGAPCCRPVPGERVVALSEPDSGRRLHSISCRKLAEFDGELDRWIDVAWAPAASEIAANHAGVELIVANEPGALAKICSSVAASGGNIDAIETQTRSADFCRLAIDLEVRDLRHLMNILRSLSVEDVVAEARRLGEDPVAAEPFPAPGAAPLPPPAEAASAALSGPANAQPSPAGASAAAASPSAENPSAAIPAAAPARDSRPQPPGPPSGPPSA